MYEAWLPQKLGKICRSYSGGTPSVKNHNYYIGNIPFIRSGEINSESTELLINETAFNHSSVKMVSRGDILYALYGATSGEVAISKINGAINQAILAIKPECGHDTYYIYTWLNKQRKKLLSTYLQGGQGNLSGTLVKSFRIYSPLEYEQEKIGEFFKKIDSLIAKHTQKLELLKKLKKGYLQKIFSQELRFDGFHELWRKQKLKEIISLEFKGKAKANMLGKESRYLETSYLNGGNFSYVSAKADTQKTDILILWDGSQAGTVYYGFSGALGTTLKAFRPKYSGDFLYHFLKQHQQKIYTQYRTPNIPHVIKTFTNDFFVTLPYNDEQERIGYFLNMCDNFISKTVKKIELLDSQKQGYLQKMFI
ncbi:MAG: restriction endonuclease subunit S [Micrococcaceae bacterium]